MPLSWLIVGLVTTVTRSCWKYLTFWCTRVYLNSCYSALRFLSSVFLIIAWPFGLFIVTLSLYVLLFVNLRLLTTHLVSSNCNCITQKVRFYLEFGIPQFYKRVKYVVLQLNKSQIKATILQLCFYQSRRARTLTYVFEGYSFCTCCLLFNNEGNQGVSNENDQCIVSHWQTLSSRALVRHWTPMINVDCLRWWLSNFDMTSVSWKLYIMYKIN